MPSQDNRQSQKHGGLAVIEEPVKAAPESPGVSPSDEGRIFRVVRGVVGPWNLMGPKGPDVFTESEFARHHPLPTTDIGKAQVNCATYHADLLDRLLRIGVIVVSPGSVPTPTPIYPGSPGSTARNSIQASTERVMETRQLQRSVLEEQLRAHQPQSPEEQKHGEVLPNVAT